VTACRPERGAEAAEALAASGDGGVIAYGAGRSYGDAALNDGGRAVLTARLDRILEFDPASGRIVCEPGVSFYDLLSTFAPRGYLTPVNPGTGFATIGGALANDVHGKNHDRAGSFGDHVEWFDLALPGGEQARVAEDTHPGLFAATIGGLGLTGIVLAICFRMVPVPSPAVRVSERRMPDLDAFLEGLEEVRRDRTYSVGWIDALSSGRHLGRGILEAADAAEQGPPLAKASQRPVPIDFPPWVMNPLTIAAFNELYYRRIPRGGRERVRPVDQFFYPLDSLSEWNRLYGKRGFYQFQCVLPEADSRAGLVALLEEIIRLRSASFLAVLKTLGGEGRGYLSFPMRGHTLALDFPRRRGADELLARLERITLDHGGRVYLAKDARLSAAGFAAMYPKLPRFREVLDEIDPQGVMASDLARRLGIRRAPS
jgi:decaprenylphospho-beta-D-ribofuranose 2-oxidase